MSPTERDPHQVFRERLEQTLQWCEREAGIAGLELCVEVVAPEGRKVDTRVIFKPKPANPELHQRAKEEVMRATAKFEDETDCWVDRVSTTWTREETPRRFFVCTFRPA